MWTGVEHRQSRAFCLGKFVELEITNRKKRILISRNNQQDATL
jgi:hypothetical protein